VTTYNTIRYEVQDDGLLLLTLNRPDRLNAFTVEMADELEHAWRRASADDAVRVVVVTGEGRAFCAGMDLAVSGNVFGLDESLSPTLADLQERPLRPEIERGVRDTGGRVALAMLDCLKPIVGAINGAAVGVGATMTLPMDFRFASSKARLGFVFGRIGATPDACSTWLLPRLVGIERALELFYQAEILTAQQALDIGLVRSICEPADLMPAACAFARRLVQDRSAFSIGMIRRMVYAHAAEPDPRAAHDVESLAMFRASIGDAKEGVAAFLEKRAPRFSQPASSLPGLD
jgi:enoyl-CoA hydratase/carnithine racemase